MGLQAVSRYLAAEGVAVHAKQAGSPAMIPFRTLQNAGNILLFKFRKRGRERHFPVNQLRYQRF